MATKAKSPPPPAYRPRYEFKKQGTQYVLKAEEAGIELRLGRLKRSGQELSGELQVLLNWEGVRTVEGVLHQARLNLSSTTARGTLTKALVTRTQTAADESMRQMDWADAIENLCQRVLQAERQGEPIVSMNGAMPESRRSLYDVEPIAPHAVVTIVYGPGGVGKSIFGVSVACSIAKGMEIIPGLAPQVKGPVIYLDYETDQYTMRDRVEMIANGHGFKTTKDFYYRRCNRPLADDADELAAIIAEKGIKFVVVDSCGPAMGTSGEYGDANESTIKLFEALRRLGVTVLLIDHVSKQQIMRDRKGEVIGSMPYGSVYKVNLARATWELQNGTSMDDDDVHIRLVNTKANDARLHDAIDLSIVWDKAHRTITWVEDDHFIPEEYIPAPTPDDGKKPRRIDAMVEAMREHPDGLTTAELATAAKTTQGSIRNVIGQHQDLIEVVYGVSPPRYRLKKKGGI